MGYRVDLSSGEVVETNAGGEQDLSAVEERAVHEIVADWTGAKGDPAVDLSEDQEKAQDRPDENAGGVFGVEDLERIAQEPDTELPEEVREDAELHAELRAQEIRDRFGEDDLAGVTDDEMWAAYLKTLGEEDK